MNNYRIKKLVWSSGKSYVEISEKSGICLKTLENWCLDVFSPTADNLIKLSTYFDVSTDWILGLTDKKEVNK